MTGLRDPYGVLGLPRGASLDEVKRAYRRLAKQHHPDSGGERTLERFLEIQAAYEQLVHGRPGAAAGGTAGANAARRAPWQADPVRADATRRAYGSRGRRSGTQQRDRKPPDGADGAPPREEPRRRGPRKATLGSTSYDEAADQPFDPDWTGASWYGTTSGTYWTLNPREYADPRKHGPEYQARARRRAEAGEATDDEPPDPEAVEEHDAEAAANAEPTAGNPPRSAGAGWRPAAETSTATGWSATPGTIGDDGSDRTRRGGDALSADAGDLAPGDRRRSSAAPPPAPTPPPGVGDLVRLFDPRTERSPAGRLGLALVGGLPVAIWLAWLLGELTGCGRFAATCEPGVVSVAWIAGFVLVVALILLPAAAAILVAGAAGAVVAAVPATVFLTATGGARMPDESGIVLGVALILGWLAGVMLATNYWWRGSGRPGPVS